MLEMPPARFVRVNGVRLRVYEAGPADDAPPTILLHGWPEIAFTWRRQIKALCEAGIRVVAPDQRGFGASDAPAQTSAYAIEHLTGDLAALLDALAIDKAIFVGHDWGGFVAWEMPLRYPDRVAGVVALNTPHLPRAPADPIAILRKRYGERMYIVQFQDSDAADRLFAEHTDRLFEAFLRAPVAPRAGSAEGAVAGIGAASDVNLDFPALIAAYDPAWDTRAPIMTAEERQVFVDAYKASGFTGGLNWYRNITANWERSAGQDRTIRVPALMMMAELDAVQPPSAARGMEALIPDLETYLVRGSGHWTQEERPDEVSAKLIEWRRRRFS
ncbi:MAG: alpha/beta hydrolase [Hyphomicrobiales bacterium]|nr:alpha/beta hydrolase [Hyphomicrobiales bacterium]